MGVSGCGKTTIGKAVALRLGWDFQEGDDFHPAANVAKMRRGIPLDDADREPWLNAIETWMRGRIGTASSAVVTCSALKRAYRRELRAVGRAVSFLYLRVSEAELRRRLAARHHEYMPASLLASQLAVLEEPGADETDVVTVEANGPVDDVADDIVETLRLLHQLD